MSDPGVLLSRPLAQFLAKLYGRSVPLPSLDRASRSTDRAPGAQLCRVLMVNPEYGSDLNAEVLLSVCGYNPGDMIQVEALADIAVPPTGSEVWVIHCFDPTEVVNGEHCPPHWVVFSDESCQLWYQLSVEGNPSGGTFPVHLYDRRGGGLVVIEVTLNWDDDDDEVRTALAEALSLDESEVTVSDGPLPNNALWVILPASVSLSTPTPSVITPTLTRNGPLVPYSRVTSCCR